MTGQELLRSIPLARLDHLTLIAGVLFFSLTLSGDSLATGIAFGLTLILSVIASGPKLNKLLPKWGGKDPDRLYRRSHNSGREAENTNFVSRSVTPSVTVIIPVRNTVRYLRDSVESALSSEGVEVRVLLFDDASTDGSTELGRQLEREYDDVVFRQSYQNVGPFFLRNVGLLLATTEFVAFLDSDDTQDVHRLKKQITPMLEDLQIVATSCKSQRWSEDLSAPIGEIVGASITTVFRKSLVNDVGYFDSVFFGGDTEFRHRLLKKYGSARVVEVAENLYTLRFRDGSLTRSGEGQLYILDANRQLSQIPSVVRTRYERNYRNWHNRAHDLFMPFPLRERPFEAGSSGQSASPYLGEAVYGFMATFPERQDSCQQAVGSIIDQVDEVHLHLNGYQSRPGWTALPKLYSYSSSGNDLKDVGKFAHHSGKSGYLITLDDDIEYPADYVSHLLVEIELANRTSVVGVHGISYSRDIPSLLHDRDVDVFWEGSKGRWVDAIGTGTLGYHSTTIGFTLEDFPQTGITDLFVSKKCKSLGVPLYSVPRVDKWLKPIETPKESRLFERNKRNQRSLDAYFGSSLAPVLGPQESWPFIPHYQSPIHIVVTGWNCEGYVEQCLDSIGRAASRIEEDLTITIVNDGSTDKTQDKIEQHPLSSASKLLVNRENMGAAFSRHLAIKGETRENTVMVLVDMDDALSDDSLARIQDCYSLDSRVWMTLGNWATEEGLKNPQSFYNAEDIAGNAHRWIWPFLGTHLRTFKHFLYDRIPTDYLLDSEGEYLRFCTDAAIVLPLLDQCGPENVRWIPDPIYIYRSRRKYGTIDLAKRAGVHKRDTLEFLAKKPTLSRPNMSKSSQAKALGGLGNPDPR